METKEKDISWYEIEFKRLRNKIWKETATEKEIERFHEVRRKLGISWDGKR